MKINKFLTIKKESNILVIFQTVTVFVILFLMSNMVNAEGQSNNSKTDRDLLSKYIESKGNNIIVFDAANIKQYWPDISIVSKDGSITVLLNSQKNGVPLKIQLANVIETEDCKVEIMTKESDLGFWIKDKKLETLAASEKEDVFLSYNVFASTIHLEDTEDFSFNIVFNSSQKDMIQIEKIILSFSKNLKSSYLGSPGFNQLLKIFDEKGIKVSDQDVQYYISKEYNKIFFKIPDEMNQYRFFYHAIPVNEDDILPIQKNAGYKHNNYDFSPSKKFTVIPKPYSCNSQYTIIQKEFPPYECQKIMIGQFEKGKRFWTLSIEPSDYKSDKQLSHIHN